MSWCDASSWFYTFYKRRTVRQFQKPKCDWRLSNTCTEKTTRLFLLNILFYYSIALLYQIELKPPIWSVLSVRMYQILWNASSASVKDMQKLHVVDLLLVYILQNLATAIEHAKKLNVASTAEETTKDIQESVLNGLLKKSSKMWN